MALPKHYLFDETLQDLSNFGFVLAHPARLQLLELFNKHKILELNELMEHIPLSAATISDHLRYLERAGLLAVGASRDGRSGYMLRRQRYETYLVLLDRWLAAQGIDRRIAC